MTRRLWIAIFFAAIIAAGAPSARAQDGPNLGLRTHYAILVDGTTGQVLWTRNADVKRPIASTTKILTAVILLERGHPNDLVIGPPGIDKVEESSLHLKPGEKIPLHDLLYAMLLRSANDTAVAGAIYLSGSLPAFAGLMNEKAAEIGAKNSHFVTPNGLYAPDHYSTAADLAKIAVYAVNNVPEFNNIVRTERYKVHRSKDTQDVWVKNTATTFLRNFPGADGIKTGYIRQAGHCFVGSATRNNTRLIAVALNSTQCREDVMSLLDYGFAHFQAVEAVAKDAPLGLVTVPSGKAAVPVIAARLTNAELPRGQATPAFTTQLVPMAHLPEAPFPAGTKLGTFNVIWDGKVQETGDALAASPAERQAEPFALLPKPGDPGVKVGFLWACGVLAASALTYLGVMFYGRTTAKSVGRRGDRLTPDM